MVNGPPHHIGVAQSLRYIAGEPDVLVYFCMYQGTHFGPILMLSDTHKSLVSVVLSLYSSLAGLLL